MKIETIKVKTVAKEKLIEFLAIPLNEKEQLSIDTFAVFEDKFAVDTDCCFWAISNKYHNNNPQKPTF
jgi:hypothetical protein